MANGYRFFLLAALLLLLAPRAGSAQQLQAEQKTSAYAVERSLITSTLEAVVAVIQETTLNNEGSGFSDRLRQITAQLSQAAYLKNPTPRAATGVDEDDLDDLRRLLLDVAEQLEMLREDLEDEENYESASRLARIERDLQRAVRQVDRMKEAGDDPGEAVHAEDGERWLRPGRHGDRERDRDDRNREARQEAAEREREARAEARQRDREARAEDHDHDDRRWRRAPFDWTEAGAFVGEYGFRWPYRRETALYRSIPAVRYNRVDGFVLGIGRRPMDWDSYGRADVYGQLGYAFALDEWRYEIGLEARLDRGRRDDFGLKVGGAYRRNTDTKDQWKLSWLENSLSAFFFENDFFDYHEVEGWTVYAVQRLTPFAQVSAGYRQEDYRSLEKNTSWSVFDGDGFPFNPPIDEGEMKSFVATLEGGRVVGLHNLPRGVAFRLEAEIGDGVGGDFAFNRYVADGRVYVPVTDFSSLALRLRGGLATGDEAPFQKTFSLGGIGSVRAYPQNSYVGSRMLLGNAEYLIGDVSLLDGLLSDFQLIGFADVGWVNAFGTDAFDFDDVIPAAGLGLGLDDRDVRLELAWPLRDLGDGQDPTLWLRITPNF